MAELRDLKGSSPTRACYSRIDGEDDDSVRVHIVGSAPQAQPAQRGLKRVLFEARQYSTMLLSGAVMLAVSGGCRVRLPSLLGHYLTRLARGGAQASSSGLAGLASGWSPVPANVSAAVVQGGAPHTVSGGFELERELMWLLGLVTAIAVCEGANRVFMTAAGESLVKRVRGQLFEALLHSGMETHEATPTGELVEQINMDVVNIRTAVRSQSIESPGSPQAEPRTPAGHLVHAPRLPPGARMLSRTGVPRCPLALLWQAPGQS